MDTITTMTMDTAMSTNKSKKSDTLAIFFAVLAAALYAISTPVSKMMLQTVAPTMVAAFLYIGAGMGMSAMMIARNLRHRNSEESLQRKDLPFVVAMVVLDIVAPILMMYGLKSTTASNTALLNNFEIVATALIALLFFHERISLRLWVAIVLVTIASILLSLGDDDGFGEVFHFSRGSLLIIGATVCWGLENNCTRQIANRDPMQIVTVKGFGSGVGALVVALCIGESVPKYKELVIILLLGYVAYGLSIYFYTLAQRDIGAAKTSTYYAVAPFIGALLSILLLGEPVTFLFVIATAIMVVGCWVAVK